ncbi:MAG: DUF58 domain-containing protein [Chloroflexi bacterium]|nr:DUF58 domain-containing protein [Chloroflexota bacterium]MCI0784960.1 DUF58 domain-containing protein [Chloroflexota bacterium]
MITAKATGFISVAILLFLVGRVTLVGWVYLVDAVLWGIIILSFLVPWLGAAFLEAQRRVDRPKSGALHPGPAEGDLLHIDVSVRNRAFFPRFLFNVYYDCPVAAPDSRLKRFFIAQMPAWGQVNLSATVTAYQRGLHHLGPVTVESSAPFGLFRRRVYRTASEPVLVYPMVHPLRRLALVEARYGESVQPRKSLAGMDPVGSRHYFPGDPRRYIHWRNTAKMGRPMVKEFEDAKDPTLDIIFDAIQVEGEGKDTTLEYSIKIAVSAADYAIRNQGTVRVWGGNLRGETAGVSEGDGMSWPALLRQMSLMQAGEGWGIAESLSRLPPGCSALVIVSSDDQEAIQALIREAPRLERLVVVALAGFGETEATETRGSGLSALERSRVSVLLCRPHRLPDALESLERLGGLSFDRSAAGIPTNGTPTGAAE